MSADKPSSEKIKEVRTATPSICREDGLDQFEVLLAERPHFDFASKDQRIESHRSSISQRRESALDTAEPQGAAALLEWEEWFAEDSIRPIELKQNPRILHQKSVCYQKATKEQQRVRIEDHRAIQHDQEKKALEMLSWEHTQQLHDVSRTLREFDKSERHRLQSLSKSLKKSLRTGHFPVQAKLDLHGFYEEEAERAFYHFLLQSRQSGLRYLLIVTGKGEGGRSILRTRFSSWLKYSSPWVRASFQAHPRHGGGGAFYLILKKK